MFVERSAPGVGTAVNCDSLTEVAAWSPGSALSRHEAAVGLNYIKAFKSLVSGHWTDGERRRPHWTSGGAQDNNAFNSAINGGLCQLFLSYEETLANVLFSFIVCIQEASSNDYRLKKIRLKAAVNVFIL